MDLSDKDTWIEGLRVVTLAPHIVWPLLIGTFGVSWWFCRTVERAKRDGLQAIINGRDAQIVGLQGRVDLAKDQQAYLSTKLGDAEKEIAKLNSQIQQRAMPATIEATANSTANLLGAVRTASTALGQTLTIRGGGFHIRIPGSNE